MARNIGWVASSRGFNSVASILYLALAARTLGPAAFGHFALILTYAQFVANLVQFQSWKGLIRYGALHVADDRMDRLERLFGFTAFLDFSSAVAGALVALVGVPLVAPLFDWSAHQQVSAAAFGVVLLLTTGGTPTGMLRLFNRFDLAAFCEAVGPLTRLIGSAAAWVAGGGVSAFLGIWALAAVLQSASQWAAALLINRSRIALGVGAFRQAVGENVRLWPFMLQTNISNSISLFWTQLGTLAVGAFAGPVEAGGFRLARGIARGLLRPVQPVTLALYPELSRLVAQDDHSVLRKMVVRVTLAAAGLATLVVVVMVFGGDEVLRLLAGKRFEFAKLFLVLLSIASAFDLAGFAFEPVQNAHGFSWKVLQAKLIAAAVYGLLLLALLPTIGAEGAAFAAIAASALIFVQLAVSTAAQLRRKESAPGQSIGDTL